MISKNQSKDSFLLVDGPVIMIPRYLLSIFTKPEAMVLQQFHYWLCINERDGKGFEDGYTWTYITYESLSKQLAFDSRSLQRTIRSLENKGILISGNYNRIKYDRTKWYRIDYDVLEKLLNPTITLRRLHLNHEDKMTIPIHKHIKKNNDKTNMGGDLPINEPFPITITKFVNYYINNLYNKYKNNNHPQISDSQYNQVCSTLTEFIYNSASISQKDIQELNEEDFNNLIIMAKLFFEKVGKSNHSIIHFCQRKILDNRLYEMVKGDDRTLKNKM